MVAASRYILYSLSQQFDQAVKHSQLELQLLEAKLAQQSVAMAEARENSLAERQFVRSMLTMSMTMVCVFSYCQRHWNSRNIVRS